MNMAGNPKNVMSTTPRNCHSSGGRLSYKNAMTMKQILLFALMLSNTLRGASCSDINPSVSTQGTSIELLDDDAWSLEKQYYTLLKLMGLGDGLNTSSTMDEVLNIWAKHQPVIQKCETLDLSYREIKELPYDALNKMEGLAKLDLSYNPRLEIDPRKFETLQRQLTSLRFTCNKTISQDTFNAIIGCEKLETLSMVQTSLTEILRNDENNWEKIGKSLKTLDISCTDLNGETFSKIVSKLSSLKVLIASGNKLGDLPDSFDFSKLLMLERLDLMSTGLNRFPESICALQSLTHLYLANNRLASLPKNIENLKKLKMLCLVSNQLEVLPETINALPELLCLGLGNNQLRHLPLAIGDLSKLVKLNASRNKLSRLPESICDLMALKNLDVAKNALEWLPGNIGNLLLLEHFGLQNNRLKTLPVSVSKLSELRCLRLSNNKLKFLPKTIESLKDTLTYIDIRGNPEFIQSRDRADVSGLEELKKVFGNRLAYDRFE